MDAQQQKDALANVQVQLETTNTTLVQKQKETQELTAVLEGSEQKVQQLTEELALAHAHQQSTEESAERERQQLATESKQHHSAAEAALVKVTQLSVRIADLEYTQKTKEAELDGAQQTIEVCCRRPCVYRVPGHCAS